MSTKTNPSVYACWVAGNPTASKAPLEITNPYSNRVVGCVGQVGGDELEEALERGSQFECSLSRYERAQILSRTASIIGERREEFARGITDESGLCLRETRYEMGRGIDVLQFAAAAALEDDGSIFSCDISPQGKNRKIFSTREPLNLIAAITPFNHPFNTVIHKLAPAIAIGSPVILKPSEKTPLTALRLAEALYQAGLPGPMLSVILGGSEEIAEPLVRDERVDLVTFTGSVKVGKQIAATAGYKKVVLELGGNDPLIVLANGDLDLAVHLAAEGAFRNAGQRCTAVKRILVEESIAEEFTHRLVAQTKKYPFGDPYLEETRLGPVIDEPAAIALETVLYDAVSRGAQILTGGKRHGALMEPTVVDQVPRDAAMVVKESFGPLAPILRVSDLEDAITVANSTRYGLSAGIVTDRLKDATRAIKRLRSGNVNVNEVPGYRIEKSPFGGIKDSGLGIKEGVLEAMKCMSNVKTFSLPWDD